MNLSKVCQRLCWTIREGNYYSRTTSFFRLYMCDHGFLQSNSVAPISLIVEKRRRSELTTKPRLKTQVGSHKEKTKERKKKRRKLITVPHSDAYCFKSHATINLKLKFSQNDCSSDMSWCIPPMVAKSVP